MRSKLQVEPLRAARAASNRQLPGARMSRVASGGMGHRRIRHSTMSMIASRPINNRTKSMERPLVKNSVIVRPFCLVSSFCRDGSQHPENAKMLP